MADNPKAIIDTGAVDHVLKTTRSIRLHLDLERAVPADLIESAIDVALQAPTGANSQTWRFVVVTDASKRARIAELYRKGSERYLAGETGLSRTGVNAQREYPAATPRPFYCLLPG